jgi:hypothetical protein
MVASVNYLIIMSGNNYLLTTTEMVKLTGENHDLVLAHLSRVEPAKFDFDDRIIPHFQKFESELLIDGQVF